MTQEALKLALEALERFEGNKKLWPEAITAIKEALAQTQEPVACVQDLDEVKRKHLVYEKGMDWKDPLYTHPPQRTWVGLTDEDKHEIELRAGITEDDDGYIVSQVFKLTEAKLKEKNT